MKARPGQVMQAQLYTALGWTLYLYSRVEVKDRGSLL